MSFKDWINRHWIHDRDEVGDFGYRAFIHIWIGLLIGLLLPFSYPINQSFLRYERNEDIHTKDQAWKDIFGELVGLCIGTPICVAGWIFFIMYLV